MSSLPPPNLHPADSLPPPGRGGPTRGVVIGTAVALALVTAAVVAVTIVADDDSTSDQSGESTTVGTDGSTVPPTSTFAADLPTAAAAARLDEVVDESGVGDDGRYNIDLDECPLAEATFERLVRSMLDLGDAEFAATGPTMASVTDIRFDGPTYSIECEIDIGEGADDASVIVTNTPQPFRGAAEAVLDAEEGPTLSGGTIMRSCQQPEENGCGVGWLDDEIGVFIGLESELAVGIEPDEIESLLVAELPGLVDELAG